MPRENLSGDYMSFRINWDAGTITLQQASPAAAALLSTQPVPITPVLLLAESLSRRTGQGNPPYRFLIDLEYDRESCTISVHSTEDFHSVVQVPQELLRELLRKLLTPRETEAAILLFEGRTIRYIAVQMRIAEGTVKRMIHNIYKKMNLASQVELIRDIYARLAQHVALQESKTAPAACGGALPREGDFALFLYNS